MKVIKATIPMLESRTLVIGFQAENQRTQVRIDCAPIFAEYPHATPSLAIKPPAGETYPVFVNRDGNEVVWTILSENLALVGDGELQLTFVKDSVIAKTIIGHIRILRSLVVDGETPDPVAQWIDDANAKLAEVDAVIVSIDEMDAVASGLPEGADPTVEVSMVNDHKRLSFGIPKGDTGEKGDKGDKGDRGEVGATPQMGIGTVQTLPAGSSATASMSGTTENPLLNLGIPQGIQGVKGDRGEKGETGATGATGATPDFSIGTVSTLPAGSSATAEITGTPENPVLSLGIPQGEQGVQGEKGEKGDPGEGVPVGGLTGQVLAKASDTDRDTKWMYVAPVIKNEASGSIASFLDGADGYLVDELKVKIEPVQDLHGYDHPWPAGGGKNLLAPFIYDQVGSRYTANADGTITASISDGGDWIDRPAVPLKAGTYTVSYSATSGSLRYKTSEDNYTEEFITAVAKTFTLTADGGIKFKFGVGASAYPITVKVQLESGSTATAWTPYSNICPITGWDGVKVTRTGKNLFDKAQQTHLYCDGSLRTYSNADMTSIYVPLLPNTTYTFSQSIVGGFTRYSLIDALENMTDIYDPMRPSDKSYITHTSLPFTFTNTNRKYLLCTIYRASVDTDKTFDEIADSCQLEYGSTATDYEPYAGNTYDITLPTEAGTVYGGELTVNEDGSGSLVVDRKNIVYDGSNNYTWTYLSNHHCMICGNEISDIEYSVSIVDYQNSYGIIVHRTSMNAKQLQFGSSKKPIETIASSVEEWKSLLNANPIQVVYSLATPITYTLTASQIRTLLGQNNVWSDAGDVFVKYNADTKLYIDGKIAELVAQIVNS